MAFQAQIRNGLQVVAAASIMLAAGCEKPTVAQGAKATAGGIEFSLGDYEVRYLEVTDGGETYEYPQPALVLPVTVKNVGEGSFAYTPTHATQQMSESQTPLLYLAPTGEDADDLPPANKTMINGVFLAKGTLDGQISKNETIAKGESITDLLLFEVPDAPTQLVLSIPPSLHRGKFPVLFKVDFKPQEARGPKVYATGEAVKFGTAEFKVTGSEIAFIKTRDNVQGEGFSSEPLFKVSYEITNNGSEPFTFDPAHRSVGGRGAALYGKGSTFKRVKFASSTSVEGQQGGTMPVAPGSTVKDFVLFDRPPEGTTEVSFEYPAALFGATGIARIGLPFEYSDPPKPKELEKPAPAKAD